MHELEKESCFGSTIPLAYFIFLPLHTSACVTMMDSTEQFTGIEGIEDHCIAWRDGGGLVTVVSNSE